MTSTLSRRGFLAGLIAAPAILKLGIYMPIKPALGIVEAEPIVVLPQVLTLMVPSQFATIELALAEAGRLILDPEARIDILVEGGYCDVRENYAGQIYVANSGPNRKARRRAMALA